MFLGAAATWMKVAALVSFDTLLKLTRVTPRPDRVLIVRLDGIGDFVLWLDAAQALVEFYKASNKSTVLVANSAWAYWAEDLGIFAKVVSLDVQRFQRSPMYRYRVGVQIRSQGCTVAVEPTYSRTSLLGDSVIRISGASERIGSIGDESNLKSSQKLTTDRWYTKLLSADPSPCMELERNAEFVRNLCGIQFLAKMPGLEQSMVMRKNDAFASASSEQPYYVLFPGAGWKGRQWPLANFAEAATRIYHRTGWLGVVCGGKSDIDIANTLCRMSQIPLLDWSGRTDLAQLASILSSARLLLSNDTSAVHIAAACGVPTVCLLGGGHYGRFLPYQVQQTSQAQLPLAVSHAMPCFGCNWQCIYDRSPEDPVPCIAQIATADAWDAISQVLAISK